MFVRIQAVWLIVVVAVTCGVSLAGTNGWSPVPFEVRTALDRAVYGLMATRLEANNGDQGGGIRRLAKDNPRETLMALYRRPDAFPEAVRWTREVVDSRGCQSRRGVTLLIFTARAMPSGESSSAWSAVKTRTCLEPAGPVEFSELLSTNDAGVRKIAAEILQRLAK